MPPLCGQASLSAIPYLCLGANGEITQRANQLMTKMMMDARAIVYPTRGMLLKVAKKVIRTKSSSPVIAERKQRPAFNQ
jgi:hypothetical protein